MGADALYDLFSRLDLDELSYKIFVIRQAMKLRSSVKMKH